MISNLVDLATASPYIFSVIIILLSFGSGFVLNVVVIKYLKNYTEQTDTDYDSIVVNNLQIPLVVTISLVGFSVISTFPSFTENIFLSEEQILKFIGKPVLSIIVLVWAYFLNRVVNKLVGKIQSEGKSTDSHGRTYEFAPVFSNIWTLLVIALTLAIILLIWNYDVSPLLGAAGIGGIAIGIAAKESVSNFIGGLSLYIDDTYAIGDYLELDTGDAGTVSDVGIRSTMLRTKDNVKITLPNSMLNEERIVNKSEPGKVTRIKVDIGVAYGTDIDMLEEVLIDIAESEDFIEDNPAPEPRFLEFGGSSLNYQLICWVETPTREPVARHRINREIYQCFKEEDIEIPYDTHDLHLKNSEVPDYANEE